MKTIHIYLGTKKVYSVYANSIEEVKENPQAYYEEYKDKMIISEVEYSYPVLENETLREATREELVARGIEIQLEEGEKIVNKKLIKIKRPSKFHTWNSTDWTVNLEEVKTQKREELKRIRAEKIDSDLEVNGNSFQVRERDLQNFYNLKIAVDIDKTRANEKLAWVLADNSIKEFSYAELMGVLGTYIARKQEIFTRFGILTMQLEACKTVEEIEAIKWE